MPFFAIFFQSKLESQQFPSDSLMNHTTYCTYKAAFLISNAIWKNYIREIPNVNVFQLYHYCVVITEKYSGDLLQRTSNNRLRLFEFSMRVISKQWCYVPLN